MTEMLGGSMATLIVANGGVQVKRNRGVATLDEVGGRLHQRMCQAEATVGAEELLAPLEKIKRTGDGPGAPANPTAHPRLVTTTARALYRVPDH
jgi:hypothetical protein